MFFKMRNLRMINLKAMLIIKYKENLNKVNQQQNEKSFGIAIVAVSQDQTLREIKENEKFKQQYLQLLQYHQDLQNLQDETKSQLDNLDLSWAILGNDIQNILEIYKLNGFINKAQILF
ncbi:unnamed protein product (macronuclear) [Paramecium tetraurelia]|uniref:Uncharacterized protein n=1 Tax=Paramecium tetraurelia TaxID=5888 RepID=A0DIW1_PARTE|nr:uncharacterized protein GSPATT00017335001 [Paramecium tetraurelia]CAK82978.1 unnamed protein product [Paramecium tetraurelia]|eukprot:XP_001450375.1 hypothetical protein (macronuclear) [Paramecium tetraurelia strain d4-2]